MQLLALPADLLIHICTFVDTKDLCSLIRTCTNLQKFFMPSVWKQLTRSKFQDVTSISFHAFKHEDLKRIQSLRLACDRLPCSNILATLFICIKCDDLKGFLDLFWKYPRIFLTRDWNQSNTFIYRSISNDLDIPVPIYGVQIDNAELIFMFSKFRPPNKTAKKKVINCRDLIREGVLSFSKYHNGPTTVHRWLKSFILD